MIPAKAAINRVKRDITLAGAMKMVLLAGLVACAVYVPSSMKFMSIAGIVGVWVALGISSARSSRLAMGSPMLIASGEFDAAEEMIDQCMRAFSIFSVNKIRALHQLAVLRHAQKRWMDSAILCQAMLSSRLGRTRALIRPAQLMLAESLLELNDLLGAHRAISDLYAHRLNLEEALLMLSLQTDYEARIGAWRKIFDAAPTKVLLAELMQPAHAVRTQSLLALAAHRVGRPDWRDWLRQRTELLADVNKLVEARPMLQELWHIPPAIVPMSAPQV